MQVGMCQGPEAQGRKQEEPAEPRCCCLHPLQQCKVDLLLRPLPWVPLRNTVGTNTVENTVAGLPGVQQSSDEVGQVCLWWECDSIIHPHQAEPKKWINPQEPVSWLSLQNAAPTLTEIPGQQTTTHLDQLSLPNMRAGKREAQGRGSNQQHI